MECSFHSFQEGQPGPKWHAHFTGNWTRYRRWFLSHQKTAHLSQAEREIQLRTHMPELMDIYQALVLLAGNDSVAASFLSLYDPPPYLTGCSQAAWTRDVPALIRNYDYGPSLYEGALAMTIWRRPVIAMLDCLWGVLDGLNDAGLAVSLSFGGSKALGRGFAITLILRYLLETCEDAGQACTVLKRIPSHMAYNVTLVDREGRAATAYLHPERKTKIEPTTVATNHQFKPEWEAYARHTASVERGAYLNRRLEDPKETLSSIIGQFFHPPLYQRRYREGFGTLYTAVYYPRAGEAHYLWPRHALRQGFGHFKETRFSLSL